MRSPDGHDELIIGFFQLLTSVIRAWDTDGKVDGVRKRILVARKSPLSPLSLSYTADKQDIPAAVPSSGAQEVVGASESVTIDRFLKQNLPLFAL